MRFQQTTLNCNGQLVSLERPAVMGILNATPDSFFDGGKYQGFDGQMFQVEKMLKEGATFIDIGGMSSRPGAEIIDVEEELKRVIPLITGTMKRFPETLISIDTVHAMVAEKAVAAGACIVNDISASSIDAEMYPTVAKLDVPYILMHMQGRPQQMQVNPTYENVALEVLDFFIAEVGKLRALGVKDLIIDPGFGFGKTIAHNYQLLTHLHTFKMLEAPILAGLSRKSMICKVLKVNPSNALNGTTALHMVALQQGAKILRVHDVEEAVQCVRLFEQLMMAG
ncbi:MAG: dihydropteroate synthase [Bacteroidota bacterium]